jgi:hypothetical protein
MAVRNSARTELISCSKWRLSAISENWRQASAGRYDRRRMLLRLLVSCRRTPHLSVARTTNVPIDRSSQRRFDLAAFRLTTPRQIDQARLLELLPFSSGHGIYQVPCTERRSRREYAVRRLSRYTVRHNALQSNRVSSSLPYWLSIRLRTSPQLFCVARSWWQGR